jgi:hypothetical protein
MDKFIKLNIAGVGADSGFKLISINDILEVKQESNLLIQIFYKNISTAQAAGTINYGADANQTVPAVTNVVQAISITLVAAAADTFAWKNFLNESIETALTLSWQQPVFTPAGSSYPPVAAAGAAPSTISTIVSGVKAAS